MPQLFSQMRMSCESYNDSPSQLLFWVVHTRTCVRESQSVTSLK